MSEVVELNEWSRALVPLDRPTREDLRLLSELEEDGRPRLAHRWLRNGQLELRSTSWVGVVRLSATTIHIRPKYAGAELGVIRMLAYAGGYRPLRRTSGRRFLPADGVSLLDLLCHLLAEEAEALLRDGLLHDYSPQEESLPALRGSLRFRDQATRRFGQLDALECRFDEFHADILDNQLLRAGLNVATRICHDLSIRRRLRRLETSVGELASLGPPDAEHYRQRLSYSRRNERYRAGHELSLLLLERLGVDDLYGTGATESFAFLIDMNEVFESFVATLIAEAFSDTKWRVTAQRKESSVIRNRLTGKRYASIIPDIVLSDGWERIPFDCKYKLYGDGFRRLSTADIYQTFLYAFALGQRGPGRSRAGIIFPGEATATAPHLEIRPLDGPPGARLTGISVDLLAVQRSFDNPEGWVGILADVRRVLTEVLDDTAVA